MGKIYIGTEVNRRSIANDFRSQICVKTKKRTNIDKSYTKKQNRAFFEVKRNGNVSTVLQTHNQNAGATLHNTLRLIYQYMYIYTYA